MQNYDKLLLSLLRQNADDSAKQLFELLPVGIGLYNKSGILVDINQYSLDIYGITNKRLVLGRSLFYDDLLSPEFQERFDTDEEVTLWHYYYFGKHNLPTNKKGRIKLFTRFKTLKDENNNVAGYVVINMEETSHQSTENTPAAPAPIETYGTMKVQSTHDENHNLIQLIARDVSPNIATMLGKSIQQMEGNNLFNLHLNLPYTKEIAQLSPTNKKFTFFYYVMGTRRYLRWSVYYIEKDSYFCRLSDITDYLMDNRGINFSETLFRTVFDKSPVAIALLNRKGEVEDVNDKLLEIIGLKCKEEILGFRFVREVINDINIRKKIDTEDYFEFEQAFKLEPKMFYGAAVNNMFIRMQCQKYYLPDGGFRGYICYMTDLTQEKAIEESLISQKEKAVENSNMKSRFLQNMSHDIRTPLNAIVGFSQLLGLPDGTLTAEEKEEFSGHIANNSNMLIMLVDDILNISDVEAGNYKIVNHPIKCNELCENTLKSIEYRIPCGVKCYYTSDVDNSATINTDGRRVQQVLINFLTNACKHTKEGEILLECKVNEDPNMIRFSVIDTGEGIDPSMADDLFERFVKLNTVEGTGLGLNICKTISQKLGGDVSLDKSYTNGAKFDFYLPKKPILR